MKTKGTVSSFPVFTTYYVFQSSEKSMLLGRGMRATSWNTLKKKKINKYEDFYLAATNISVAGSRSVVTINGPISIEK